MKYFFLLSNLIMPIAIVSIIALLLGITIVLVAKFFAAPVNKKQDALTSLLPGANCGGCGFSGCVGYAVAIADGTETDLTKCTVGGSETVEALAGHLGQSAGEFIPKVAHIFCHGTCEHTHPRYNYVGSLHCASAHGLFSGPNSCTYGCLGFGDCKAVCDYNAIYFEGNIAHINMDRCVACGKCVTVCPKKLIQIIPKHLKATTVKCSNHWTGAQVRKNCSIGCISCGKCVKICPVKAIKLVDLLAVVDQYTCIHCGLCATICPTNAIHIGLEKPSIPVPTSLQKAQ